MKAAVITGKCRAEILEIPEPHIRKNTEIKIRVISAAICNTTDNMIYATDHPEKHWPFKPFPFVLGHECSGVVIDAGSASGYLPGDRIVYWTIEGGAFAEYLVIDTSDAVVGKINDSVSDDIAAMMEMVIGSARLLFTANGEKCITPNDKVLVIGLGPAGLIYTRLSLLMGAKQVVCAGRGKMRLDTALTLGASHAINTDEAEPVKKIREAFKSGADVIIDATGGDVVDLITTVANPDARLMPYGIAPFDWNDKLPLLLAAGIKKPMSAGHDNARQGIGWCIEKAERGELGLEPIVTHRLPLEQVGYGLDLCRLEKSKTLKVIIEISSR